MTKIKDFLKKKTEQVSMIVRIPVDKKKKVQDRLKKDHLSFNALVNAAIDKYLGEK